MNRINIDDLKYEYIGKVFGSLEVLDVIRNDSNLVVFRCKCVCGNIKDVPYKRVIRGATKSCGCRASTAKRLDVEKLKQEYIGKQINWLTITNIYRDNTTNNVMIEITCKCGNKRVYKKKQVFGKNFITSCGCHHSTEEYKQAHKMSEACKKRISDSKKQFHLEHPEAAQNHSNKMKLLFEKEPERRNIVGQRISNWFKSDKDGVKKWANKRKQFYKDHPEIGEARSELYRKHPEILEKIANGNKEFNKNNPEKVNRINQINREIALAKRLAVDYSYILDVVHPDDVNFLIHGGAVANSLIRTKCPNCGKYEHHLKNHLVVMYKNNYKIGKPPLCKKCHVALTSCFSSKYEQEIADCISDFYNGECIKNDRSILNGKELDLYYPDKRIAIEFNGDYWHDENHKSKEYHYNKFKMCLDKNILLVSIFESEWNNRKDNIVAYIRDLFNNCDNSITFENDGYMNNNYPSFGCTIDQNYFKEDFYTVDNVKVYTCGYSKIICS